MTWQPTLTLTFDPITPVQLALFAAASGDHNPLHLDPEAARRAGFERPVVHGMLSMALAARLFTQALGPGCVRSLHTRFAGVALAGDRLVFTATLQREEAGLAHYSLSGNTPDGTAVVAGTAIVGPRT